MAQLPAFCPNCGAIFPAPLGSGGNIEFHISNVAVGPCPNCGETGYVPDGVYEVSENVLRLLSGPKRTIDQLKRLARTLRDAQKQALTPDEIQEELDRNASEFSELGQLIDEYASSIGTVVGVLNLMLALILAQVGRVQHESQMSEHEETQEIAEEALNHAEKCTTEENIDKLLEEIESAEPTDSAASPTD